MHTYIKESPILWGFDFLKMNIVSWCGNKKSYPKNIQDFETFVERQIEVLNPELIIAAGTGSSLPKRFRRGVPLFGAVALKPGQWLISTYHPAQTRIRHHDFYERIVVGLERAGWRDIP
jgi:uracil-DNA glycosylase